MTFTRLILVFNRFPREYYFVVFRRCNFVYYIFARNKPCLELTSLTVLLPECVRNLEMGREGASKCELS